MKKAILGFLVSISTTAFGCDEMVNRLAEQYPKMVDLKSCLMMPWLAAHANEVYLPPAAQTVARSSYVRGYSRKNGSYVSGHHRTTRNGTKSDNYSTTGNVNPYTGKEGTK